MRTIRTRMARRHFPLASVTLGLASALATGCVSLERAPRPAEAGERVVSAASVGAEVAERTVVEGVPAAAAAPLRDLNLQRKPLPKPLRDIAYVYQADPAPDCAEISRELARLDPVLGRDYDADAEIKKSVGERGGEAAGDYVIDTVQGAATGWIPYRGLVREVSGAARYDRSVARAFTAGHARRAYLKGLGVGLGCQSPAAPSILTGPEPEDEGAVELRGRDERDEKAWGPETALPPSSE